MTPDEFKSLINEIGNLIDKRAETTELAIKGHVSKELAEAKEELETEILASRAEAKADILNLEAKLFRKVQSHGNLLGI